MSSMSFSFVSNFSWIDLAEPIHWSTLMLIDDVFVENNISANLKTQSTEGRSRLSEHQTVTFSLVFVWMADLVALKADLKSWEKEFKLKNGREARKEDIKAVPEIGQSERRREQ